MPSHYYAILSRMKNIYRWGLMRNTKQENLSEHSLEVALIAHCLALISNKRLGGKVNPEYIATAALFHDTSEIITGDMPTPIKYYNAQIKGSYKEIEKTAENKLLSLLPEDLRDSFATYYNPDDESKRLIKAADKISALIKCIEELNMGNREFAPAEKATRQAIKNMECAEADIFVEEFLPGFALPLDNLL